jgi:AmiR/NasT family two-component response regulator
MLNVFLSAASHMIRSRTARIISRVEGVNLIGMANNSQAAVEAIQILQPDILILSCHSPHRNVKALKKIRKFNQTVIVIILTDFSFPEAQKQLFKVGADYILEESPKVNGAKLSELLDTIK